DSAGPADLAHVHRVRAHEVAVDVLGVGVTNLRLAAAADPELEEVPECSRRAGKAEIGGAAALVPDDRLDAASADRMLRREDGWREGDRGRVAGERLRQI